MQLISELIMIDVMLSQKNYGSSSNFKRPRVSAFRDYPRECGMLDPSVKLRKGREEIANVHLCTCRPVLRKYPPPKIRKRIPITRDFPVKPNAPAVLRDRISDSKGSNPANEMSVADYKGSDGFDATNVHVCMDAKQGNLSGIRHSKPSNAPNANNVCDIHACIKYRKRSMSMVFRDCKLMDGSILCTDVRESSLSMVVGDEQYEGDVSIANNVYACPDVWDSKPSNIPNATNVHDIRAFVEPKEDGMFMVFKDCKLMDVSILTKGSLSVVVRDEQCSDALFEEHDYQAAVNDEEQCSDALFDANDYQAAFSDEGVKAATFVDVNNSQVGLSMRINCDKVKEVINLFQEVHSKLLDDKGRKQKGSLTLEAASILHKQQKWINMNRRLGPIPGIEVGDYFDWRAELNIIGLHRQHFHGIDYMELDGRILATSVVDSGRYDNVLKSNEEQEFPDTLIYSGEGANPKVQSTKSIDDQKLERGNLALKNSSEVKTPIRVIRKVSFVASSGKTIYRKFVYDGLYFVDSYRQERASSGKLVFKFMLKRFPGQPKVDWTKFVRKKLVCVNDISQGKEMIPIRALNALDDEKPPIFNYVTSVTYSESYHPSMIEDGCDCSDGCSDSEDCPCIIKSGGSTYNYEQRIMKAKPLVIECGPCCKCFTSCINRVSQRGIRFPLEIFKTKTKGWGVRSRSWIPCGSFICEYTGEIIPDKESERRIGKDEYLFDIGNSYGDHSLRDTNTLGSSEGNECFTIDAAQVGNVGRFINHGCSPNLFTQDVLFDHDNKSMPHVMLFAMEDIPPLEELTYDYNYKIGEVCDANGNIKMKNCYCGSSECTGRMY
ncbi:LOW QUALITY PROTEIN: histone-lysine N-methyltransferase, H3 lysine-9 specific SUVH5-like [Durio zibethinus]|uniref:LOW QUALITY PROTEIN: histone-lysine N-methyltransferase, H3 lysine-9 specific SUVH5-like n=1 Tax=Durio zibethinus TaxID=66656 RepID=A0A6P5YEP7_DURZI|nr:LOW QUALITY PROTEIN: histone-lysine N-methyltransferase, H3 lysine-9 specific SUVH5-like [Durio zibethinus]